MSRHVKRGKADRTKRRKTLTRRNAPKSGSWDRSLAAGKETNIRELARERDEALGQLAASSDVLQIISRSPGELEPVFTAMLNNAVRICEAKFGVLFLFEGDAWRAVALHGAAPPSFVEARQRHPVLPIVPGSALGRVTATKQVVQISDVQAEPAYRSSSAYMLGVETGDIRTVLSAPMLKDGALVGAFNLFRQEVRPFTDKQIELVQNFAAQAVIAIENTRLLKELRQRTDDLTESLEQQTATSEVLRVISSSPGELEPVFQAMLENARRICEAEFGALYRCEGDALRAVAMHGAPQAFVEERRRNPLIRPPPQTTLARAMATKQPVQIADIVNEPHYFDVPSGYSAVVLTKLSGARTVLTVPMVKENELIGAIVIYRTEVRPFSDKQIELVKSFAAQAVIAIENTRLLNELREALEQQTATANVLSIISSSPGELEPVFQTMLENATRICEAKFGVLFRCEGDAVRAVAMHGAPQSYVDERRRNPVFRPAPPTTLARALATKNPVQDADALNQPQPGAIVNLAGARTILSVPMLKENELIGAIVIYRQEVRPFTDKQIKLVENFAAQAVIAIENTRLLNDLRQRTDDLSEALERQTATADVLKIISSSPGDLQPVFNAMLENATRICEAKFGNMFLYADNAFQTVAVHNAPPVYAEARTRGLIRPSAGSGLGRLAETRQVVHIADMKAEAAYAARDPFVVTGVELAGIRTLLAVPMLREGQLVGAFSIFRQEVRPFTDKQIELVQNFAAQAVIAIENARLLNELRQSLEQQTATADVLKVISSSPGDLEPVFQSMLVKAVQICEAKFGVLFRCYHDSEFHAVAWVGVTPEYEKSLRERQSFRPDADAPLGRLLLTKELVHTADELAEKSGSPAAKYGGARSLIAVPMRKQNELVGALVIYRTEVRPFTDKQIELVRNFAAQAVIAIENARLLNDLNKLNQQLEHRVTDQVSEIERMGRLRRFLPPQVADLIVASGTEKQLESHRREITALFCDLRGFTGFSESSDPEDVMALLREYHAAIGGIINKYGGTLERYAGDGVMVVFNDPIPLDRPALQAVLMAIDMRAAIGELIEKWRKLGHEIGFGIGIAHGFATLGTIGFEGRFDYAAIGTVSNVASRLCDEAKPGQILISPRVLMAVENDIAVEPVGDFELKGIRRPMTAYNVLAAKAAH